MSLEKSSVASNIFRPAENNQAYLKAGLLGFGGSGKSRTSWEIAAGLAEHLGGKGEKPPILYTDSETGSDFFKGLADLRGLALLQQKTRAFDDLLIAIDEAKRLGGIYIVDSITHFWVDLTESYMKKKNRTRLQFQDWGPIKKAWGEFSTAYVTSPVHILMAGRAGYEYDYSTDDEGVKTLEKTGVKMKAEGEMGYEPSLLVQMKREAHGGPQVVGAPPKKVSGLWDNVAEVLKDRFDVINGAVFRFGKEPEHDKVFEAFWPHISRLNLGGKHVAYDVTRNSEARFSVDPERQMKRRITDVHVALEEIEGLIVATEPGSTSLAKAAKGGFLMDCFGTRSWTAVENMNLELLLEGYEKLKGLCEQYLKNQAAAKAQAEMDAAQAKQDKIAKESAEPKKAAAKK